MKAEYKAQREMKHVVEKEQRRYGRLFSSLAKCRLHVAEAISEAWGDPSCPENFDQLYDYQDKLVSDLVPDFRSRLRALLDSPTGSGKTKVMQVIAALKATLKGVRVLIVIPQQHQANGFMRLNLWWKGQPIEFVIGPERDFRGVSESYWLSSTAALKEWFAADGLGPNIAITTVSTLLATWNLLTTAAEMQKATTETLFMIDEIHHARHIRDTRDDLSDADVAEANDEANRLGEFITYVLKQPTAEFLGVSATHFRGDRLDIFHGFIKKLHRVSRTIQEHLEWLKFTGIRFDYLGYDGDPMAALLEAVALNREKSIIILLTSDKARYRKDPNWIPRFFDGLEALVGTAKICDLVRDCKDDNKMLLMKYPTRFQFVVGVNLIREGTDWPPASLILDAAPSRSLNRLCQTFGRLLRKYQGKAEIAYVSLFANLQDNTPLEEIREMVADRVNIVLAGLLSMADMFGLLPVVGGRPFMKAVEETFGEDRVIEDFGQQIGGYFGAELSKEQLAREIEEVLAGRNCNKEAARQILREVAQQMMCNSLAASMPAYDSAAIREAGFDIVHQKFVKSNLNVLGFGSDVSAQALDQLKEICLRLETLEAGGIDSLLGRAQEVPPQELLAGILDYSGGAPSADKTLDENGNSPSPKSVKKQGHKPSATQLQNRLREIARRCINFIHASYGEIEGRTFRELIANADAEQREILQPKGKVERHGFITELLDTHVLNEHRLDALVASDRS
jgi:energy-coupling factor transporter ATP-binding protein EcfA2